MKDIITKIKISPDASIKDALKRIDAAGLAILFVCDDKGSLLGSLSDGDIRRKILKTSSLQEKITDCFNPHPIFIKKGDYTTDTAKNIMLEKTVDVVPVVDKQNRIVDVLFWKDVFEEEAVRYKKIDIPVVIMAGGKGTRLDPFTKVLPKPLIPIGEKTIIDIIMNRFHQHGVKEFYISISHKARIIKSYFEEMNSRYTIHYLEEEQPLGTAGSLKFLEGKIKGSLLVSNCDTVIDYDYSRIVEFHKRNDYDMTIVGSFRHEVIPYGICEIENGGLLKGIKEKPEYDFLVNTGMYLIKGSVLQLIPKNRKFDITDMIESIWNNKRKVGVFPISEKAWTDIGQWEEYKQAMEKMRLLE